MGRRIAPPGTLRIIGAVVVAGGRAMDLALIESDGADIVRRMDLTRVPLAKGLDAAGAAILSYMGDRTLQPSAIDAVALAHAVDLALLTDVSQRMNLSTILVEPGKQWPHLPLAERVALVAGYDLAAR